jgi:hypothetical protein
VTGAVRVGDRLTREDSINGDRAAGAVVSGSDTYIYSDTLEVLNTAGNVVVIRNGGKVSQL